MICLRWATRSASSRRRLVGEGDALRLRRLDEAGDHLGVHRLVLARWPSAWAKWRTCAGLVTSGKRSAGERRRHIVSKPPVASTAIRSRLKRARALDQSRQAFAVARDGEAPRSGKRERRADPSTRRPRHGSSPSFPLPCETGLLRGPGDCPRSMDKRRGYQARVGLQRPRTSRRPLRYRARIRQKRRNRSYKDEERWGGLGVT